jgi:hypothetical protein
MAELQGSRMANQKASRRLTSAGCFTERYALIQERADTLISDLRRLAQLIEADIQPEEKRGGILHPTGSDYPVVARQLRARQENLTNTIAHLEETLKKRLAVPTTKQVGG